MKQFWPAHASVAVAALAWGMAPVAIRYLSGDYGPHTQAFFRYLCATVAIVAYSLLFCRRGTAAALRRWRPLLLVAALNVAGMVAWTQGCYRETATIAQLITKLYLPIVVVLSYLLFHGERRVIRNPKFVAGSVMGIAGVVLVLIDDPSVSLLPSFRGATFILAMSALFWAGYNVLAKHVIHDHDLHPVGLFTVVSVYSTVILGVLSVYFEWPVRLGASTPWMTGVAAISGILPIAIGHSAFHFGQKHLGAAYCGSLLLITPFISNSLAVLFWEDEVMIWIQWAGVAVLLVGSFLVIQAGRGAQTPPPE